MHLPQAIETPFIFFPQHQLRGDPGHVGLEFDEVWLTTEDGVDIHSWFIRGVPSHDDSPRTVMLMTHGNGGNISIRLDQYREFIQRFGTMDIFTLEYRGYGLSGGYPSEDGIALDALAARRWLDDNVLNSGSKAQPRVVYFGRSLGGAVATRLAAVRSPDALILECAFTSIPDLAKMHAPWRYLPLDKLVNNRFDTASHIPNVHCPILIMHSEFDEIVPRECGDVLHGLANEPKRHHLIPNAPHNGADLIDPNGYYRAIDAFLNDFVG